ncbi:hypothetical protein Hamer_G008266, partial [Homarus americanus]
SPPPRRVLNSVPCLRHLVHQSPVLLFSKHLAHLASSSECDRFQLQKEILNIRTRDKVSFAEARNAVLK